MSEFAVGQSAGERQAITPPVKFHLPTARPVQLRAPRHSGGTILQRGEREPPAHGQGADLSKPLRARAVALPAAFQLPLLDGHALHAAFRAPGRADAVRPQPARRVGVVKRRDAAQREAAEHVQPQRRAGSVLRTNADFQRRCGVGVVPAQFMDAAPPVGMTQHRFDAAEAVRVAPEGLALTAQGQRGRRITHRAALGVTGGRVVPGAFDLDQRVHAPRPARGQETDFRLVEEIAPPRQGRRARGRVNAQSQLTVLAVAQVFHGEVSGGEHRENLHHARSGFEDRLGGKRFQNAGCPRRVFVHEEVRAFRGRV